MTHEQKATEIVDLVYTYPGCYINESDLDWFRTNITTALHEAASARDEIWKHRLVSAVKEARCQALKEAANTALLCLQDFRADVYAKAEANEIATRIRALAQEDEV